MATYLTQTAINNELAITASVLGNRYLSYVNAVANKSNTKSDMCDILVLYTHYISINRRIAELINDQTYQAVASKLLSLISLTNEYYIQTQGGTVISANIAPPSAPTQRQSVIYTTLPAAATTYQNNSLIGATLLLALREGIAMPPTATSDGYSFSTQSGTITINTAANGSERFLFLFSTTG